MPRDLALARWLVSTSLTLAVLLPGCAGFKNTPAQDEAWNRWAICQNQVTGLDIKIVRLDGQIVFWTDGPGAWGPMLDCLAQAGKNGPALPEAVFEFRPRGGG